MKDIPEVDLEDPYKLIMAHNHLGHYVEEELTSEEPSTNRWDIVDGIQRAWSKIYPGFCLGQEDLMSYNYDIFLAYPHLLAHAKWENFMQVTQQFLTSPDAFSRFLWIRPSQPYQASAYDEGYYRNIAAGMSNMEIPYPLGLEMLMHLTNYLPKGPEQLLQLIYKESVAVRHAISHVMFKEFKWPSWTNHDRSEQEMNEIKHFINVLDKITPIFSKRKMAEIHLDHVTDIQRKALDTPSESSALELLNPGTSSPNVEKWRRIFQKTSPATTMIGQTKVYWYHVIGSRMGSHHVI
ncbi:uncharacterized protein MELLADRAFT_60279 [Melampsora larici-populina 98AG31]|uniref:Uncharacterized protein n=1 Tax=Melampsora larici-populina (strain 98AG31 / pathotype 3-4-7) TaxID=747676 RepID=F4RAR5_MELLP|nr:uncharacterized protein MELLADRAFT_60279 [Melampsora larici-populina 98AG31]EGG10735.1 hypothetical protein MELLADRAFT_60279 [Melampsora larici-populina 98AG31]